MIEVRKIRMVADRETGKSKKIETALSPEIKAPSISHLLNNPTQYLGQVTPQERFNLYFTLGHGKVGHDGPGRTWASQDVITFDIDHVEYETTGVGGSVGVIVNSIHPIDAPSLRYEPVIRNALGLEVSDYGLIATGYGIQVIIPIADAITDKNFFKQNQPHYKICADKLSDALAAAKLPGHVDLTAFESNRLHRMPGTINRKAGRADRQAFMLKPVPEKSSTWNIAKCSGLPTLVEADSLPIKQISRLKVDTVEVQKCNFLQWAKANQNAVTEPQWYAMLSVVSRLDDTGALAHEYSKEYKGYKPNEVDRKVEYAKTIAGPRTCDNINNLWGGCSECPFYRKVNSPISIRGKDFIATKDTGFWLLDKNGRPKDPDYEGLLKQYSLENSFINIKDEIYVHTGTHYEQVDDRHPQRFCEDTMLPKPMRVHRGEFASKVSMYNLEYHADHVRATSSRKINFSNGVLDLDTMELSEHSPDYFFTYTLNYAYDPIATAPKFEKFLDDITKGREDLKQTLIEYMGYCMSGDECRAHKFLTLTGTGANGKSTFVSILQALAGGLSAGSYSSVRFDALGGNFENMGLFNRLFNIMDESEVYLEGKQFEILKDMCVGGIVRGSNKFKDIITFRNTAKFIMLCNELPKGASPNKGYYRRLLIVPFDAEFEGASADAFVADKIIADELPGIMNMALQGYMKLKARGFKFVESETVTASIETYKQDNDNVARWCSLNVTAGEGKVRAMQGLRKAYEVWVQGEGERAVGMGQFTRRVLAWAKGTGIKVQHYPQKKLKQGDKWVNVSAIEGINVEGEEL